VNEQLSQSLSTFGIPISTENDVVDNSKDSEIQRKLQNRSRIRASLVEISQRRQQQKTTVQATSGKCSTSGLWIRGSKSSVASTKTPDATASIGDGFGTAVRATEESITIEVSSRRSNVVVSFAAGPQIGLSDTLDDDSIDLSVAAPEVDDDEDLLVVSAAGDHAANTSSPQVEVTGTVQSIGAVEDDWHRHELQMRVANDLAKYLAESVLTERTATGNPEVIEPASDALELGSSLETSRSETDLAPDKPMYEPKLPVVRISNVHSPSRQGTSGVSAAAISGLIQTEQMRRFNGAGGSSGSGNSAIRSSKLGLLSGLFALPKATPDSTLPDINNSNGGWLQPAEGTRERQAMVFSFATTNEISPFSSILPGPAAGSDRGNTNLNSSAFPMSEEMQAIRSSFRIGSFAVASTTSDSDNSMSGSKTMLISPPNRPKPSKDTQSGSPARMSKRRIKLSDIS
jgi:hypothetical protein